MDEIKRAQGDAVEGPPGDVSPGSLASDTQADPGGLPPEPEGPPRLSALVDQALGLHRAQVSFLNVTVSTSVHAALVLEQGAGRLRAKSCVSLLSRCIAAALIALEFTTVQRELRIAARQENGRLLVELVDNGNVISDAFREYLLEVTPVQAELSWCGGESECTHPAEGGNLTRLVLNPSRWDTSSREHLAPAQRAARVLVVEDSMTLQSFLGRLLSKEGYVVDRAHDGYEALVKLRRDPSDLVLLDMGLPQVDGKMFLASLNQELPELVSRVVVMTADPVPHRAVASLYGIKLLTKPLDLALLHECVAQHLAGNFPDAGPESRHEAANPVSPRPRRSGCVLVVEDSLALQSVLGECLTTHGHVVDRAIDGYEALVKVRSVPFDLIFLDMELPRLDGKMFLATVNLEKPQLVRRVVVMTSNPERYEPVVSKYQLKTLAKPLDLVRFPEVVAEHLEASFADGGPRPKRAGGGRTV